MIKKILSILISILFLLPISANAMTSGFSMSNPLYWTLSGTTLSPADNTNWTVDIATLVVSSAMTGDLTITKADPCIIFDGSTTGDGDFWVGLVADEDASDDDFWRIGKGTTCGSSVMASLANDALTLNDISGNASVIIGNATTTTVFNEQGLDNDFRIEGDGDANLFYVDAGNDRVGIGTASPDMKFTVNGNANISDGNGMVIGHTAQLTTGGFTAEFQVLGTTGNDSIISLGRWQNNISAPRLTFYKSRNTTIGSQTAITTGDNVGEISSYGDDGTDDDTLSSQILFATEGTIGTGRVPGVLIFKTGTDVAATVVTEALRLDSKQAATFSGAIIQNVETIAADDATPDVSGGNIFTTSANTVATAITDLDNPTAGQIVKIIGGSNATSTTIGDSGNFNLTGGFTFGLDDVLELYVQADNDYIEVGRSDN